MTEPSDPFKRLEAATRGGKQQANAVRVSAAGDLVQPAPADAPAVPKSFSKLGAPSGTWTYRDASGQVLRYVLRFPKPAAGEEKLPRVQWSDKEIRPLTLCRDATGKLGWQMKAEPGEERPLYGLDRLGARPCARVLVVEGEKAADRASERFPDFVVVSWPGGAKAVAKATWRSLRGRDVVMWPDHDEAGISAAVAVVTRALAVGAASGAIVTLPPDLPHAWDLGDDWPDGLDAAEARLLIEDAPYLSRGGEAFDDVRWPRNVAMLDTGLWTLKRKKVSDEDASEAGDDGEEEETIAGTDGRVKAAWICGPLKVLGLARDAEGGNWGLMLEFKDHDRRVKNLLVAHQDLAGECVEVRKRLLSEGLNMGSSKAAKDRLIAALMAVRTTKRLRLAYTTGWVDGEPAFVLPKTVIGAARGEDLLYAGPAKASFHGEGGSYGAWRDQVAAMAPGNDLLLFGLACAFAGPMLKPMNAEGGGFHFRGGSSCGKTSLLVAAGSVWGGGGPSGAAVSWRATPNAVESIAHAHNDCLLALDEIKTAGPGAGEMAYALASGQMKGRQGAAGGLRDRITWLVLILSTGELSLADLIRQGSKIPGKGEAVYAGQELRLLDVSAEVARPAGQWSAWQDVKTWPSHAEFSDSLKRSAKANYGHAGPMFLERLVRDEAAWTERAGRIGAAFLDGVLDPDDTGQIRRGAERFAVVAAAGELAALFDVVPWGPGEASSAVAAVFRRWAHGFGRKRAREDLSALREVKDFLERFGGSRFRALREPASDEDELAEEARTAAEDTERHRAGEPRSVDEAGFFSIMDKRGKVYHFNPQYWRSHLFNGIDPAGAARALKAAGFLITGSEPGRLTHKMRVPGIGLRPFYSVSQDLLTAEFDD